MEFPDPSMDQEFVAITNSSFVPSQRNKQNTPQCPMMFVLAVFRLFYHLSGN